MARLMIVGESPSHTRPEGKEHVSFSGKTAHHLWDAFQEAGLSIDGHLVTNIVDKVLGPGEKPTKEMAKENIDRILALANQFEPDLIVPVGKFATEALMGKKVKLKEVVGKLVYSDEVKMFIFPIIHPAAAARSKKSRREIYADARKLAHMLNIVHFSGPKRYSVETD